MESNKRGWFHFFASRAPRAAMAVRRRRHATLAGRRRLAIDGLESRRLLAATANFTAGLLEVTGDGNANAITVTKSNLGGIDYLIVTDGMSTIFDGTPTGQNVLTSDVTAIDVDAGGGADSVTTLGVNAFNGFTGLDGQITLGGGDGDDTIIGSEFDDSISAGSGSDQVFGVAGNDTLNGDADADLIQGGDDDDVINGGGGGDTLVGEAGHDTLNGDAGEDTLIGGTGDDSLSGGADSDLYVYGQTSNEDLGADTITEGTGGSNDAFDTLNFEEMDSAVSVNLAHNVQQTVVSGKLMLTLNADDVIEVLGGSPYNDTLAGNSRDNFIFDEAGGDDTIVGSGGNDGLSGGEGDDLIFGGDGDDTLDGEAGADTLLGDDDDDLIYGGADGDVLLGGADNDTLNGDAGQDTLVGGTGNDELAGGADSDGYIFQQATNEDLGADTITDGTGGSNDLYDSLLFGDMDTAIAINLGNTSQQTVATGKLLLTLNEADSIEIVAGSPFNDHITGNDRDNFLYDEAGGNDTMVSGNGHDALSGGEGDDVLLGLAGDDTLDGEAGTDTLLGGTDDDLLHGGADGDVVFGDEGHDTINGDGGDDTLMGGTGDDSLAGGGGNDLYLFRQTANEDLGSDYINEAGGGSNDDLDGLLFDEMASGVTVDLSDDTGPQTVVTGKLSIQLSGDDVIEGVGGSPFNDDVTGNSRTNLLIDEYGGDDTMSGLGGDDFIGGGDGEDLLSGGEGNDVIDGGDGDDTVLGNEGRDILIGGLGADSLDGGADDDILIAGYLDFADNFPALVDIQAEWTSMNTYADRVDNILAGSPDPNPIPSGSQLDPGVTVIDDDDIDTLLGGSGADWFLVDTDEDVRPDVTGGEVETEIDV